MTKIFCKKGNKTAWLIDNKGNTAIIRSKQVQALFWLAMTQLEKLELVPFCIKVQKFKRFPCCKLCTLCWGGTPLPTVQVILCKHILFTNCRQKQPNILWVGIQGQDCLYDGWWFVAIFTSLMKSASKTRFYKLPAARFRFYSCKTF